MLEIPVAAPATAEVATVVVAIESLSRSPILQTYFNLSVSSIFDTFASSRG
jgi:hypothetical protein